MFILHRPTGTRKENLYFVEGFVTYKNTFLQLTARYITPYIHTNPYLITNVKVKACFYNDLCLDIFTSHRPTGGKKRVNANHYESCFNLNKKKKEHVFEKRHACTLYILPFH